MTGELNSGSRRHRVGGALAQSAQSPTPQPYMPKGPHGGCSLAYQPARNAPAAASSAPGAVGGGRGGAVDAALACAAESPTPQRRFFPGCRDPSDRSPLHAAAPHAAALYAAAPHVAAHAGGPYAAAAHPAPQYAAPPHAAPPLAAVPHPSEPRAHAGPNGAKGPAPIQEEYSQPTRRSPLGGLPAVAPPKGSQPHQYQAQTEARSPARPPYPVRSCSPTRQASPVKRASSVQSSLESLAELEALLEEQHRQLIAKGFIPQHHAWQA